MEERELRAKVRTILGTQLYGVLSTQGEAGAPHASIIAFASADALGSLVFVTPRNTRKFTYLTARPEVAFFIDDRRPEPDELMQVTGIEARGAVTELTGDERATYRALYLARHSAMASFIDAPGSALMRMTVDRYDVVDHFQHVLVLPGACP